MKKPTAEIHGLTIVLVGNFNPIIFSPVWFAKNDLIRTEEAEKADPQIIHPDIVSFNLDWLRLQVTKDRFFVETVKEPFEVLRDLVLGTFKLLRHTPIQMLGVNQNLHIRIESEEKWHKIGHLLSPKEVWNKILNNPGLLKLRVVESERRDGLKGIIAIELEPSKRVHPGLYILINDHYEVKDAANSLGCDEVIDMLSSNWETSINRGYEMVATLLETINEKLIAN